MTNLVPKFKLWFSTDGIEGVFGDGKWRLLRAIQEHGSLSVAARSLGISYRKAWGDLKKAEESLNIQFLEKTRGGKAGGTTVLTKEGGQWIEAYARFRADVETAVEDSFDCNMKNISKS